jgi:hypothetical protein
MTKPVEALPHNPTPFHFVPFGDLRERRKAERETPSSQAHRPDAISHRRARGADGVLRKDERSSGTNGLRQRTPLGGAS